jgi:hypothetical protein
MAGKSVGLRATTAGQKGIENIGGRTAEEEILRTVRESRLGARNSRRSPSLPVQRTKRPRGVVDTSVVWQESRGLKSLKAPRAEKSPCRVSNRKTQQLQLNPVTTMGYTELSGPQPDGSDLFR